MAQQPLFSVLAPCEAAQLSVGGGDSVAGDDDGYGIAPHGSAHSLGGHMLPSHKGSRLPGESAVGQDYSFCGNKSVQTKFDFETFINQKYKNGETTNYPEIFASKEDMRGLQTLIDQYLEEKAYMNYDYAPLTQ